MSADTAAVKRLIQNLKTMATKSTKAAAQKSLEREARLQELLGDYQTEDDIQNAYGYQEISEDDRDTLLAALEGRDSPARRELSEEEIYLLEIEDIISQLNRRLRGLEWDELPAEKKARIENSKEAFFLVTQKMKAKLCG